MVFMSVGDHKAFYPVNIFLQIGNIRNDKVDSQHIILRKGQTAVDDHDAAAVFKCCDIHSDLLKTAKRDNADRFTGTFRFFCI